MNTIIKNEFLEVCAKTEGAELTSVKNNNGTEFLWCADKNIWGSSAPVLFPICGCLKNNSFSYKGKEYSLEKHGFARRAEFELEKNDDTSMTFLLRSDDKTKASYPFDWEFRITYTLIKNSIEVKYEIKNLTDGNMYANVGAHEAYACPGGVEGYTVTFDNEENLEAYVLEGPLCSYNTVSLGKNQKELKLKDSFFEIDALVFLTLKSRGITLSENNGGRKIRVEYEGFPYLLLWTKYKAPYLCIEPWTGIPDRVDADGDITKKEGILEIKEGETLKRVHTLTFED